MLDIDLIGLDFMDRTFLKAIIEKFSGGPVGLDNLAAAIGEEKETIEDVIEPYLIQQGFLMRTPRGRVATPQTYSPYRFKTGTLWSLSTICGRFDAKIWPTSNGWTIRHCVNYWVDNLDFHN